MQYFVKVITESFGMIQFRGRVYVYRYFTIVPQQHRYII